MPASVCKRTSHSSFDESRILEFCDGIANSRRSAAARWLGDASKKVKVQLHCQSLLIQVFGELLISIPLVGMAHEEHLELLWNIFRLLRRG